MREYGSQNIVYFDESGFHPKATARMAGPGLGRKYSAWSAAIIAKPPI
jgi:hypothetical protein